MRDLEKLNKNLAMAKVKFLLDPSEENNKNMCDIGMQVYIHIQIEELNKYRSNKLIKENK